MRPKAQVVPEPVTPMITVRMSCQFGIIDGLNKDYLAEFTRPGTVVIEKHPTLPALFWDYTVLDEKEQLVFSSKRGEKLTLDDAIEDYFGDGVKGRVDCLLTSHTEEFPAGMTLSGSRDLWNHGRELTFRRTIEGRPLTWQRLVANDGAEKDYFRLSFNNPSDDQVHLRVLSERERVLVRGYPFGLFISSRFRYPLAQKETWEANTIIGYSMRSPWDLDLDSFHVHRLQNLQFSDSPWQQFAGYQQRQDVFIESCLIDRGYEQREYTRQSFEEVIQELTEKTPKSLSWGAFHSLFSFHQTGYGASSLYGEFGLLRTNPPKKEKK